MMTKSLALELGRHGIAVNAIAPAPSTRAGAGATAASSAPSSSAPASAPAPSAPAPGGVDIMAAFLARIPLGRQGVPDDNAKAALFLASDAADYITGAMLVVDGGYPLS
jgi:2-dehydro-3-deoxy-D-gluconate 5-dehydrogenase